MKKHLLLIGLMAIITSCISQNPKEMNSERLTYFSYDHHNTMVMFGGENYHVSTEKDGRIHVIIDESYPQEKDFYLNDSTILDELTAIVKQYKMDKYKSDYRPEMQVFDGDSWSLYYKYDSKRNVSSGGYMAWPDNYREARTAIHEYFKKWREYAITAKVINEFRYTCKNNSGCDIDYRLIRGEEEATLSIRNAEYDTDKRLTISNDYLTELQELVNIYRLKDESSHTTDDDSITNYSYFVGYSNGDTLDIKGYYTTYMSGMGEAFMNFFDRWLPVRGNLVKLDYTWNANSYHNISYFVSRLDGRFSLMHFDENGQKHECDLDAEAIPRLQKLIESFGLDKAKDEPTGQDKWSLLAFYDTKDSFHVAGQVTDEASETRGRQILEALTEFFAPYLK